MIIGITGLLEDNEGNLLTTGAGKDTVADFLVSQRSSVKVAFADPLKRICMDVYKFTYEQLWGPSSLRNAPDLRYPRVCPRCNGVKELAQGGSDIYMSVVEACALCAGSGVVYLTPRHAVQQLGTEWGRGCYDRTWVDYAIDVGKQLLANDDLVYVEREGLASRWEQTAQGEFLRCESFPKKVKAVLFTDVRFFNEYEAVYEQGGVVVRVRRRHYGVFGKDQAYSGHGSEKEVSSLGDNAFGYVIENYGTLDNLQLNTMRMFDVLTGRIMKYDEEQTDVPPFMRKPR